MQAIIFEEAGGPEVLKIGSWPDPIPSDQEVLVKVHATALNRADTLQRRGMYPPPKGASPILGLEIAGEVIKIGAAVEQWKVGDRVCALLPGGGYAEQAVVPESILLPIPKGLSYIDAAGIPEVFLTAFQALTWLAKLKENEKVLIHAGASGVGTAALQIVKKIGGKSWVTASAGKHEICLNLGAEKAIDYKTEDFEKAILEYTNGEGVDIILDFIGQPYWEKNINILKPDGRLIILAFMGGAAAGITDLRKVLVKRLNIIGSTLRARSLNYKSELSQELYQFAWPSFEDQTFKPIIDSVFDWKEVADAHRLMEANKNQGKIILKVG